jgi:HEAT repeats
MRLALALVWSAATATLGPGLNLDDHVAKSDLIVGGMPVSVVDVGPAFIEGSTPARRKIATVRVVELLKGSAGTTIDVSFLVPVNPMASAYEGLQGRYGVIFLKRGATNYELTSPYYPSLIGMERLNKEPVAPLESVLQSIGAVLESATASSQNKTEALWALRHTKSPSALRWLRIGFNDGDEIVRFTAAAGLLAAGDLTPLPMAERALLTGVPAVPRMLLLNLPPAIRDGIKDPAAIPSLTRLYQSVDVETRRAVVSALVHTNSPQAYAALVKALGDPDWEVKYIVVKGLSLVTAEQPIMSVDAFKARMDSSIAFWTNWGIAHGFVR